MEKAIRTGRIEIDTVVPGGPQWVSAYIQKIEVDVDGEMISQSFREGRLYRKIQDVAFESVEFTDPVTGLTGQISVAGMGAAIKTVMVKWMLEDYSESTYDAARDLVLTDGAN